MIERKRKRKREREREREKERERKRARERERARARARERETVLWGSEDLRAGRHESSKSTSSRSSHSFAGTLNLNVLYMTECHIIIHICHIIIPCIQQALWTWMSYIWQSVTSSYTYVTSSYLACNRHSELECPIYVCMCIQIHTHTHMHSYTHTHTHTHPFYRGFRTLLQALWTWMSYIWMYIRHIQRIRIRLTDKHIPAAAVPVFHSCNGWYTAYTAYIYGVYSVYIQAHTCRCSTRLP